MGQYLPLVVLMLLAGGFAGISFVTARVLNPPKPTRAKVSPYECGIVDQVEPPERFPVRFFLVAMIFIVFDIEIIFFYPFTTIYRSLGGYGIAVIAVFSFAVFESFVYLIGKGALNWGPARQERRSSEMVDAARTARTTIRRVGLEGRSAAADEAAA
ncbi:MAG: NADH-quinone oxidoreductase subunit A [Actinomycetes bacterium]